MIGHHMMEAIQGTDPEDAPVRVKTVSGEVFTERASEVSYESDDDVLIFGLTVIAGNRVESVTVG